jgi:hypothetical protein
MERDLGMNVDIEGHVLRVSVRNHRCRRSSVRF